jgi:ABC-type polysaccharide/polyol phosphate transport system ATPase subunit
MRDPDWVVRLENVTKYFSMGKRRDSLLRTLMGLLGRDPTNMGEYAALSGLNFEVLRGDKIGLIGHNGAGKSTLLRLIGGLYVPSQGRMWVRGSATLLAGLGVGMMEELTVEHNIFLYAAIHGLTRDVMREHMAAVLEWADLEEFRNERLRTLSTGMRSRLAFSVTRFFNQEILLLDEALTAGDDTFRAKCDRVFEAAQRSSRTMLVATHDFRFVERFCNKTLWLQKGRQMAFGETAGVLQRYREHREKRSECVA